MSINIENSKESSEKKLNQSQNDILHTLVTELHLLRKENIICISADAMIHDCDDALDSRSRDGRLRPRKRVGQQKTLCIVPRGMELYQVV